MGPISLQGLSKCVWLMSLTTGRRRSESRNKLSAFKALWEVGFSGTLEFTCSFSRSLFQSDHQEEGFQRWAHKERCGPFTSDLKWEWKESHETKSKKICAVIGETRDPSRVTMTGAGHSIFARLFSSTSINENKFSGYFLPYECSLGCEIHLDIDFTYQQYSDCYYPCILWPKLLNPKSKPPEEEECLS